jgi:hypothetical protein
LKLVRQNPPDSSTAFRLPISLLQAVDQWCDQNDVTRSQFFRRCVVERIKSLNLEPVPQPQTPVEEGRKWSPECYERFQRRR